MKSDPNINYKLSKFEHKDVTGNKNNINNNANNNNDESKYMSYSKQSNKS